MLPSSFCFSPISKDIIKKAPASICSFRRSFKQNKKIPVLNEILQRNLCSKNSYFWNLFDLYLAKTRDIRLKFSRFWH